MPGNANESTDKRLFQENPLTHIYAYKKHLCSRPHQH